MLNLTIFWYFTVYISAIVVVIADDRVACTSYRRPGDVTLGALLSLHGSIFDHCDGDILPHGVVHVESMVWTVGEINKRDDLLPNVTLGFDIRDDCRDEDVALWMSLEMLKGNSPDAFQGVCLDNTLYTNGTSETDVFGIIGTSRSATSIPVAQITGLFETPVMSFWASSNELSEKKRFPYFLRTVPPDVHQIRAIIDIIDQFQWNYIGFIHSVDSYGLHGAREFIVEAERRQICLAFTSAVNENPTEKELDEVVEKLIKYRQARVVVMFAALQVANAVLGHVKLNTADLKITWIGGDDWGFDLVAKGYGDIAQGSLFTRFFSKTVPEFDAHLLALNPETDMTSSWFAEYTRIRRQEVGCLESDDTSCVDLFLDNPSSAYVVNPLIDGVYAFAYALNSFMVNNCVNNVDCTEVLKTLTGEALMPFLLSVNFTGTGGVLFFDKNSDPPGKYILKNFQKTNSGLYESINIGLWDSQNLTSRLQLQEDRIRWNLHKPDGFSSAVPRSTCRPDCEPGFILVPSQEKCCSVCRPCGANSIVENSSECVECPDTAWPSTNRTHCEGIVPEILSLKDPIVVAVFIITVIGVFLSVLTSAGLALYRDKPLIKAASRELSSIVIIGSIVAFLAVFLLILTEPTRLTCTVSEAAISLSFTLTYAPTLLKVNRIYRIFKAGMQSARPPRWVSPRNLLAQTMALVLIQVVIIVVATSISPVEPDYSIPVKQAKRLQLYCALGYEFLASCAYNLSLILACCFYAFKSRRVPDNYNESKFIAVSVYSTLVVCLAILPVYLTAVVVVQRVAALCLAVLLNVYLTMVCVFLPKLYAAHLNTTTSQRRELPKTAVARATAAACTTASQEISVMAATIGQIHPSAR